MCSLKKLRSFVDDELSGLNADSELLKKIKKDFLDRSDLQKWHKSSFLCMAAIMCLCLFFYLFSASAAKKERYFYHNPVDCLQTSTIENQVDTDSAADSKK